MNIKESIKALLQSTFGGVQLSQVRVDQLAKRLEGKVTTDEELTAKLTAIDELTPFAEMRAEDDRARSLQAELDKLKKPNPEPAPQPPVPAPTPENDTPEWAKALIEGNKTLSDKLAVLEGNKVVADRKSLITAKLNGADENYSSKVLRDFSRMAFADDAAFNEYLTEVESDFTTHVQTTAESKLGNDVPFKSITDAKGQVSDATIDNIVNNL